MLRQKHDSLFASLVATIARLILLLSLSLSQAYADDSLEYKIKAAYLYNFTKFITWPSLETDTFNLCVIGHDPFQDLLNSLESKTALDKPIRIIRYSNVSQAQDCHIAYFDQVIPRVTPNKALTVGSRTGFAEAGGMIGFVLEDERVKLYINLKALKQNGLSISAKLIEVGTLIDGDGHE